MTPIDRTVHENLRKLLSMLPAVRDGNADAIHDARVATRRLRAAAPLACAFEPEDRWVEPLEAIRTLGRSFGRARDLDVALERLTDLEGRLPLSARTLAFLRQTLTERQGRARRRLIKTIESLPLESIGHLRAPRPILSLRRDRRGRVLEQHLAQQATNLRDAIERASGVYFPNRAHQVRVDVKKLRYLLELLPNRAQPAGSIKRLRRAQEVLGAVHDRQSLMDLIDEVKTTGTDRDQYDPVLALLAADRGEEFTEYLGQRDRLQQLAGEIARSYDGHLSRQQIVTRGLLMAGVVMAPSAATLIARRRGHAASDEAPATGAGFGRTPAVEHDRPVADRRGRELATATRE
jgi:CHAD domain-containing protein